MKLRANHLLNRLSGRLLVEGERVVRSNERMAASLRRALKSAANGEDQRLRELIREIQQLALACRTSPPPDEYFCDVSGPLQVFASFSGSLWQPDLTGHVAHNLVFDSGALDRQVLERFRALADLNLARLREKVQTCLLADDSILLSSRGPAVVVQHPPSRWRRWIGPWHCVGPVSGVMSRLPSPW